MKFPFASILKIIILFAKKYEICWIIKLLHFTVDLNQKQWLYTISSALCFITQYIVCLYFWLFIISSTTRIKESGLRKLLWRISFFTGIDLAIKNYQLSIALTICKCIWRLCARLWYLYTKIVKNVCQN